MTDFSRTGSLPYSYFYTEGTLQARELLASWQRYDRRNFIFWCLWPLQWIVPATFRDARIRRLEARSDVVSWGGKWP